MGEGDFMFCLEKKMQEPKGTLTRHIAYFQKHLSILPHHYTSTDTHRMTLAYFCLAAMALLNSPISDKERKHWIDWIYAQQVLGPENRAGFRGSLFSGAPYDSYHVIQFFFFRKKKE
jgi:prenyltransferase beta subunit